jgi:phospholipid/cholesterol/gamma-HCH transport system ATP-binding protein
MALLLEGKFERTGTFKEVFESSEEEVKGFYSYNFIK